MTAAAVVALALLPVQREPEPEPARACGVCGALLAPRERPLPEHAALGEWWDHPPLPGVPERAGMPGHVVTVLDPSPELRELLAAQARAQVGYVQPAFDLRGT